MKKYPRPRYNLKGYAAHAEANRKALDLVSGHFPGGRVPPSENNAPVRLLEPPRGLLKQVEHA